MLSWIVWGAAPLAAKADEIQRPEGKSMAGSAVTSPEASCSEPYLQSDVEHTVTLEAARKSCNVGGGGGKK